MKYRLTRAARTHLAHILRHSRAEFGIRVAGELEARLTSTFHRLAEFPQTGSSRPNITSRPVLFMPELPFLVVYRILPEHIEILDVIHAARDIGATLG